MLLLKVQIMRKTLCFQGFSEFAYRIFYTMATATRWERFGRSQTRFLRGLIAFRHFPTFACASPSDPSPKFRAHQEAPRGARASSASVRLPRLADGRGLSPASILATLRRSSAVRRPVPCGRGRRLAGVVRRIATPADDRRGKVGFLPAVVVFVHGSSRPRPSESMILSKPCSDFSIRALTFSGFPLIAASASLT